MIGDLTFYKWSTDSDSGSLRQIMEIVRDLAAFLASDQDLQFPIIEVTLWVWQRRVIPCDLELRLFELDAPYPLLKCFLHRL
jgi:hypothetical protein